MKEGYMYTFRRFCFSLYSTCATTEPTLKSKVRKNLVHKFLYIRIFLWNFSLIITKNLTFILYHLRTCQRPIELMKYFDIGEYSHRWKRETASFYIYITISYKNDKNFFFSEKEGKGRNTIKHDFVASFLCFRRNAICRMTETLPGLVFSSYICIFVLIKGTPFLRHCTGLEYPNGYLFSRRESCALALPSPRLSRHLSPRTYIYVQIEQPLYRNSSPFLKW